jgi:general stress protein 26
MTTSHQPPAPRGIAERRKAALAHLDGGYHLWLATCGAGRRPHLIPVAYVWDGACLTMATFEHSRTVANLRAHPRARVAVGGLNDVVMIDGEVTIVDSADIEHTTAEAYARVSFDPRSLPGLVYLRLVPIQIQVWSGFHEFHGRTVMTSGDWLNAPADPPTALPAWASA